MRTIWSWTDVSLLSDQRSRRQRRLQRRTRSTVCSCFSAYDHYEQRQYRCHFSSITSYRWGSSGTSGHFQTHGLSRLPYQCHCMCLQAHMLARCMSWFCGIEVSRLDHCMALIQRCTKQTPVCQEEDPRAACCTTIFSIRPLFALPYSFFLPSLHIIAMLHLVQRSCSLPPFCDWNARFLTLLSLLALSHSQIISQPEFCCFLRLGSQTGWHLQQPFSRDNPGLQRRHASVMVSNLAIQYPEICSMCHDKLWINR